MFGLGFGGVGMALGVWDEEETGAGLGVHGALWLECQDHTPALRGLDCSMALVDPADFHMARSLFGYLCRQGIRSQLSLALSGVGG